MPPEPQLRLLRYFLAVADELHFGRAAARLYIAQPSLSQQIRRLEADLGLALFERDRHGVTLTPAGRELLDPARRAVAAAERFGARASALRATPAGAARLVLGFQVRLPDDALSTLVRRHRQAHPGVEVILRQVDFTDTSCGVVSGTSDVAVVSLPIGHDVHTERLFTDTVVALLPDDHPLAHRPSVTVSELAGTGIAWAHPPAADPVWRAFWTAARQRAELGPAGEVAIAVPPNVESYLLAVAAGQLLGLTTAGTARANRAPGTAAVPVADLPPAEFAIARRHDDVRPEVAALLATAHALLDAAAD